MGTMWGCPAAGPVPLRLFKYAPAVVAVGTACVLLGMPLQAQDRLPPPPDPAALREAVPPQFTEISRVQAVLLQLLSRAFALNPGLHDLRRAFAEAQESAMVALDPATTGRLARMAELQRAHDDVAARDESPDVAALLDEGRQLRIALAATAAEARRQPAVAQAADALLAALRAQFAELDAIDPETVRLVSESDRLIDLISVIALVAP